MRTIFENEEEKGLEYLMMDKEYVVHPVNATPEEVVAAFNNKDNYGRYVSKMRSAKVSDKDIEDYFGPRSPRLKAVKEKERGEPFPIRTADSMKAFIASKINKPNLVAPEIEGDTVVFPKDKNPTRGEVESIIQTVLDNAGIKYKLKIRKTLDEIKTRIKGLVKEEIQRQIKK